MKKKFYAVKKGYDFESGNSVENLILESWNECLKYVKGVKGAKYKSFPDKLKAQNYLDGKIQNMDKNNSKCPPNIPHIYVDGSYSISAEKYAYAFVVVKNGIVKYVESGASKDTSKKSLRQIAGELEAAVRAVEYGIKSGEKVVAIFHDYEGIAHHVTGYWERKSESSIEYYNRMKKLMDKGIDIVFVKVTGHSGNLFNDIADEMAKWEINIKSKNVIHSWLKKNKLKVADEDTRLKIGKIAGDAVNNIVVEDNATA